MPALKAPFPSARSALRSSSPPHVLGAPFFRATAATFFFPWPSIKTSPPRYVFSTSTTTPPTTTTPKHHPTTPHPPHPFFHAGKLSLLLLLSTRRSRSWRAKKGFGIRPLLMLAGVPLFFFLFVGIVVFFFEKTRTDLFLWPCLSYAHFSFSSLPPGPGIAPSAHPG